MSGPRAAASPAARALASRALALGLGIAAALGLGEALLRGLRPARLSRITHPCIYEPDPGFGFRMIPGSTGRKASHFEIDNTVVINSLGFHDAEPLAPGAARPRVLGVGDSFTAALYAPREQSWTAVVEARLHEAGLRAADVVNLGLDGTGTDVHVALLEAFLPRLRPEIAVLAFYANDPLDVQVGRFARECHHGYVLAYQDEAQRERLRRRVARVQRQRLRRALFEHLHLARLVELALGGPLNPFRANYLQPTRSELGLDDRALAARRPALAAALDALERFASRCGCRLLVAPVPARAEPSASLRIFREEAGSRRLEVFDPLPAMLGGLGRDGRTFADLFFVHDAHLNAYGLRLYGEALARELLRGLGAAAPAPGSQEPDARGERE